MATWNPEPIEVVDAKERLLKVTVVRLNAQEEEVWRHSCTVKVEGEDIPPTPAQMATAKAHAKASVKGRWAKVKAKALAEAAMVGTLAEDVATELNDEEP